MSASRTFSDANYIATAEFHFCLNATTLAECKPPSGGFKTVGNIKAYQFGVTNNSVQHKIARRGIVITDRTYSIEQNQEFTFTCDQMSYENLKLIAQGTDLSNNARSILTNQIADTMDFTAGSPASLSTQYPLSVTTSGTVVMYDQIDSVVAFWGTPVAATTQDTGDTFTATAHGLSVGARVMLVTLTTTTGVSILTPYYVNTVPTADTFTLSTTSGGSTATLTTNGSATYLAGKTAASTEEIANGDYYLDGELGLVTFATAINSTAYFFMTAAAITSSTANYRKTITPFSVAQFDGMGLMVEWNPETQTVTRKREAFRCTIIPQNVAEQTGTDVATFQFKVQINGDTPGILSTVRRTFDELA